MFFKWITKPYGHAPIQAQGYFLGHFFYFRSRYQLSEIEFTKTRSDWYKYKDLKRITLREFDKVKYPYQAGFLKRWYAKYLIYKGCVLFALYKLSIKKHQR